MEKLILQHVSMEYRKGERIIDDFSYEFKPGIYGLLGPNGAGKSSLIRTITNNVDIVDGRICYGECNVSSDVYRSLIGYVPQTQEIYPSFSLYRFMEYMATLKGFKGDEAREQIESIISHVNLQDVKYKKIGSFSGGMKRRALIAQALLGDPKIIILDEPTAGLDPSERIRIRNLISEISVGRVILLATHIVSDIEFIADKILLLKAGRLVETGTAEELCKQLIGRVHYVRCTQDQLESIQKEYRIGALTRMNNSIMLSILGDNIPKDVESVEKHLDLEDVYLYYFG